MINAEYLKMVRLWSKTLQLTRNGIEHATWASPKMTHRRNGQQVEAVEPDIGNMPVSKYVDFITDRLACFIQQFSAHGLQKLMPQGSILPRFRWPCAIQ
jgi:hypothetical protein